MSSWFFGIGNTAAQLVHNENRYAEHRITSPALVLPLSRSLTPAPSRSVGLRRHRPQHTPLSTRTGLKGSRGSCRPWLTALPARTPSRITPSCQSSSTAIGDRCGAHTFCTNLSVEQRTNNGISLLCNGSATSFC